MYSRWNFQYRMGGVKSHINWNAWAHYTRNLPWCPHHEILTILSSHFAKPPDQSVPTNRGALTPQVWFQWGCLCVYIYIYIYVCSICMLCTVPCPTDSCPKTAVSSHVTAATVLAVQVREYLKINVLGTIPYFVDGNVKILRHIQNSLTWDCAAASQKDRNIDYHGHSFHVHSLEENIPQWIYL